MGDVREATADDAPVVEAVWAAVAAEGEWIGTELPLRSDWQGWVRGAIAESTQQWYVVVEDTDDRVVGAIFVGDDGGLAHVGMAILDGHRGAGLGRLLLSRAIDWATARGCHKITLEVWPHNERARG